MFFHTLAAAAIVSGFVSVVAISPQCTSTLTTLLTSSDAACLNPSGLVGVFTAGNNSIIPAVNTWLTGTCALDACTNSSLAAITTSIVTGCASDFGIPSSSASSVVPQVQAIYPTIRKVACLQHTSTHTLCVTETLTNVQTVVGNLSVENAVNVVTQFSSLTSLPSSVVCTNCVKEAYNILRREQPSTVSSAAAPLQSQCGPSFVDGQVPSDIGQTAKNVQLDRSGAASLTVTKAMAVLTLVSFGIAFLA